MNKPNSVCWNITTRCNESCKFCYRERNVEDLKLEKEKKEIIDNIAKAGICKLTFAGGEPFLVPDIKDLICYAKDKGLMVGATSNGIKLMENPELREFCFKNLDWLTLSLDGSCKEVQAAMTRNTRHVENVKAIMNEYSKYEKNMQKCNMKINTLVSGVNKDDILNIAELIKNAPAPIKRWKLFQFVPLRGTAKENCEMFRISDEEFENTVKKVKEYLRIVGKENILSVSGRKNIEEAYFVIFPDGSVKSSNESQDHELGNALRDDLIKIWENGNYSYELHEERTKNIY